MNAGGNRNTLNKPFNGSGEREWSHGFCDCFGDASTCLISWCFPCVIYSQNKSRYEHLEQKGYPHPSGGDSIGGDCCLHACLTGCLGVGCLLQMSNRGNIRRRYRIEGGGCGDCMASWCCTPCELTQESRELELEEQSMGQQKA
ncbi:PLAC8 family-domain-containing protein [Hysterangium stoloniferum]|nr:PLAC8 family-domain-containing protein [Hysterangium stoloniferum]